MSSAYPGSIDAFPTNRADGTTMATNHPEDHNNYADAINKIELTLGVDPQGSYGTVVERLDNASSVVAAQAFNFTAAEVKASNSKVLIPAAGIGTILVPVGGILVYGFVTTPFATGLISLRLGGYDFVVQGNVLNQTESTAVVLAPGVAGADLGEITNVPLTFVTVFPGPILTAAVLDGGTSYAANDTGTVDGGDNDATYIVTSVSGGSVTGFTITAEGNNYTATGVSTTPGGGQPGGGSGFTVDITEVDPSGTAGDGTVQGEVLYRLYTIV